MDISRVVLSGIVTETPRQSHELYGERFYRGTLAVPRLSGAVDELPYIAPESFTQQLFAGEEVGVEGQLRSYRRAGAGGVRLQLMVFVRKVREPMAEGTNDVEIAGSLLRAPCTRKTPLGREISDLLMVVQRPHGKKDCIPCIAWGKHAHACTALAAGDRMRLLGRLQSRAYQKELPDGTIEDRTTYEVSISTILWEHEYPC